MSSRTRSRNYSIVQLEREQKIGSRCGYCKSAKTYFSYDMTAHTLDVKDYQHLIDRGWRRSGMYCYKPKLEKICCPLYTIRCEVEDFKLSKSQKRVLKRMNYFLKNGRTVSDVGNETVDEGDNCMRGHASDSINLIDFDENIKIDKKINIPNVLGNDTPSSKEFMGESSKSIAVKDKEQQLLNRDNVDQVPRIDPDKKDSGGGQSAEFCSRKKAKIIRLENKFQKLIDKGYSEEKAKELTFRGRKKPLEKDLESLIEDLPEEDVKHKLEMKLVRTNPTGPEYEASRHETFELYKKYQTVIHDDDPKDCTYRKYARFLLYSPLEACYSQGAPPLGYGSFHHQYWLDGSLIAVGVLDILPNCISSVYFFYDPDLRHLNLGTYGSLREIALVRLLGKSCPTMKNYNMGFYIHTCPKMNYKAQFSPSFLLCPETYTWIEIEKCLPKFDRYKYSRLEENKSVVDKKGNVDITKVVILHRNRVMPYRMYRAFNPTLPDESMIQSFANLVGLSCVQNILLVRD